VIQVRRRRKPLAAASLAVLIGAVSGCGSVAPADLLTRPATVAVPLGLAAPADGRGRFRAVFCSLVAATPGNDGRPCDAWLHRLPGEADAAGTDSATDEMSTSGTPGVEVLFVPGLLAECFEGAVKVFEDAAAHLERKGIAAGHLHTRGRASTPSNARLIADQLLQRPPSARVVLVSHSKGTADALHALATHHEAATRVAALISVAGAVNGSPLADAFRMPYETTFGSLLLDRCPLDDRGEMRSLSPAERENWLVGAALPRHVAMYSLVALPTPARVSAALSPFYNRLAGIDARNDGQVLFQDAVIPGSTVLGYLNADHWAVALPMGLRSPLLASTLAHPNDFPRAQAVEAALRVVQTDLTRRVPRPETTLPKE
jgi:hypothetical protein